MMYYESHYDSDAKGHRMPWKPFEVTSLISYEGRPGRFTLVSASTTPSSDHVNESPTPEAVENGEGPHITALIVRHEIDYPFGIDNSFLNSVIYIYI